MKTKHRLIAFIFLKKDDTYKCSKDGLEYAMIDTRMKRYFSQALSCIQWCLWKIGINIHNPISNECTPDFSCCIK